MCAWTSIFGMKAPVVDDGGARRRRRRSRQGVRPQERASAVSGPSGRMTFRIWEKTAQTTKRVAERKSNQLRPRADAHQPGHGEDHDGRDDEIAERSDEQAPSHRQRDDAEGPHRGRRAGRVVLLALGHREAAREMRPRQQAARHIEKAGEHHEAAGDVGEAPRRQRVRERPGAEMRRGPADIEPGRGDREREPEVDPLVHADVDGLRRLARPRRSQAFTGQRLVAGHGSIF